MGKRGGSDVTVLQMTFSLILVGVVIMSMLIFIKESANNVNFKKNFMVRDVALIVNSLYLSPGDSYVNYNINEDTYRFGIGRFEEGYRVKAGSEGNAILNEYPYVEDSYKNKINMQIGDAYSINGIAFMKNDEGITVLDISSDWEEGVSRGGILEKARKKVPGAGLFIKEDKLSNEEKIENAKAKVSSVGTIRWPVESKEKIVTSCYGNREDSAIKRCGKGHCGIDIRVKEDGNIRDVLAAAKGSIMKVNGGNGEILIDHGQNVIGVYSHLSKFYVKIGDKVGVGQKIGKAGNKGNEERIGQEHLHFGIIIDGLYYDPFETGVFNAKEIKFVKESNCFENSYSYELGEGI